MTSTGLASRLTPDMRLRLLLALATFVIAAGLAAARSGHGAPDFDVFWAAARHWRAPYDPAVVTQLEAQIHLHGVWPFAYPPTFLIFVYPFALLPLQLAYPLWAGVTSALFIFAASCLIRPSWAAAVLIVAPPVFFAAELGQTSLPIGAAMIGGWLMLEKRPALAGVLFAIAACIKPQMMILAPIVLWGRWRTLGWMAGAGGAIVAASLVFGFQRWLEWPHALAAFSALVPATDRANPSALLPGPYWAGLLAVFGVYLAWSSRNLVGLIGGALCLTPYAHAYDLAPLAPLAASWLFERKKLGWGHAGAGGALLAGLVATPAAVLAFLVAIALFQSRWWPFRGDAAENAGSLAPLQPVGARGGGA
ncbi:MAG: glycosyltransferase family 87 protein [Caulobacterales bacterium]